MDIRLRLLGLILAAVSVSVAQMKDTARRLFRRIGPADQDADDEVVTDDSPQLVEHRVILLFIGYCK